MPPGTCGSFCDTSDPETKVPPIPDGVECDVTNVC